MLRPFHTNTRNTAKKTSDSGYKDPVGEMTSSWGNEKKQVIF